MKSIEERLVQETRVGKGGIAMMQYELYTTIKAATKNGHYEGDVRHLLLYEQLEAYRKETPPQQPL